MSRRLIFVAVAAGLVAATSAASRPEAGSAACSVRSAAEVTAPRDCTIRGTVSGQVIDPDGGTTTWAGNLVLRQRGVLTGSFDVAAGSKIRWEHSGHVEECTTQGEGELDYKRLVGGLGFVERVRPGLWEVDLDVRVGDSVAGEPVMPVTDTCPNGTSVRDISSHRGRFAFVSTHDQPQPARNRQAVPPKDLRRGTRFAGTWASDPDSSFQETWTWNLSGRVFADTTGRYGLDFIKDRELLYQWCTASGKRWAPYHKRPPAGYTSICAYEDVLGFCTIGYGHLLHGKKPCTAADNRLRWTKEKAEETFREDIEKRFEPPVRAFSSRYGLHQCQFDALMSFIFNVGVDGFASLTAKLPAQGWEVVVLERLQKYINGKNPNYDPRNPSSPRKIPIPGLIQRRFTEAKWFFRAACPCQGVPAPRT